MKTKTPKGRATLAERAISNLTARDLEMEQVRRAIAKSEESLGRLHAAVEACQRKHLRRCEELRRQTRLQAIAMKEAAR